MHSFRRGKCFLAPLLRTLEFRGLAVFSEDMIGHSLLPVESLIAMIADVFSLIQMEEHMPQQSVQMLVSLATVPAFALQVGFVSEIVLALLKAWLMVVELAV